MLLLNERAQSSLAYDRRMKRALHARHGVPETWIVDLAGRTIETFRTPSGDAYPEARRAVAGEIPSPSLLPGITLSMAEVLG